MPRPASTRTRILRTAAAHFMAKGYQRTSLQAIADELGLTKATILYHFPAKEHLAAELVEPVLVDLEALVARAANAPPERRAWSLIEEWVDAMLSHRAMFGMLRYDISLLSRQSQYHRLLLLSEQAIAIISGPDAGQRDRVRAVQALAMASDPIVFYLDAEPSALREDMLDGVRRLLDPAPPSGSATPSGPAGGRSGRRRGRPAALSAEQMADAQAMYQSRSHTMDEIATRLGVSRATLYRHLRRADF